MGGTVLQSGNVTNGHLAKWLTSGVIGDAGPQVAGQRVIASGFALDFNSTADQPLIIPPAITAFQLTGIICTNSPVSLSTATGGFYPQVSKGGSAIVSAGQVYSALTGLNLLMQPTLTAFALAARFSSVNLPNSAIYFSLTTPQGQTAPVDVYLIGVDLSPTS